MNIKSLILAFLLPGLFCITQGVFAQDEEEILFSIEGKVIDFNKRKPVKDAIVKLIPEGGISAETRTDKKGRYKFETIGETEDRYISANTNYTIMVSKVGYKNAEMLETTIGQEDFPALVVDFELLKEEK